MIKHRIGYVLGGVPEKASCFLGCTCGGPPRLFTLTLTPFHLIPLHIGYTYHNTQLHKCNCKCKLFLINGSQSQLLVIYFSAPRAVSRAFYNHGKTNFP
jgi:hypothetical protein